MTTGKVRVSIFWMEHSGGTKFYQVFEFRPIGGGVPMTMTHWGPMPKTARFARPVNGGTTQLLRGAISTTKTEAKLRRGYRMVDTAVFGDKSMLDGWWTNTFGAALRHDIEVAMFGHMMSADAEPIDDDDNEVVPGAAAPIDERPANWGTW